MEISEAPSPQSYRDLPIPFSLPTVDGWESKPIDLENVRNTQPLVPLGMLAGEYNAISTRAIYAGDMYTKSLPHHSVSFDGALLTQFVRKGVADRLIKAQEILRKQEKGLYLVVYDGYRPVEVQQALWDATRANFVAKNEIEGLGWSEDDIDGETRNYASPPSTDPEKPSPHLTGGAVDLGIFQIEDPQVDQKIQELQVLISLETDNISRTRLMLEKESLIRAHARELNFGTPFDYFAKKSAANYYEHLLTEKSSLNSEDHEAMRNRRLLRWTMLEAGFSPDDEEWWHFDNGNQMMTARGDGNAVYGGILELSDENKQLELGMRRLLGK